MKCNASVFQSVILFGLEWLSFINFVPPVTHFLLKIFQKVVILFRIFHIIAQQLCAIGFWPQFRCIFSLCKPGRSENAVLRVGHFMSYMLIKSCHNKITGRNYEYLI